MDDVCQRAPHLLVAIRQISCDCCENLLVASLSRLGTVEAVTRSQTPELSEVMSNRMRDGRFTGPGIAVEPEYTRSVILSVVDPRSDLFNDFFSGSRQTFLCRVQSSSFCIFHPTQVCTLDWSADESEIIESLQHEALTQLPDAFQHPVHDHHRVSCCLIAKLLHDSIEHGVVCRYRVIGLREDVSAEPDPCK